MIYFVLPIRGDNLVTATEVYHGINTIDYDDYDRIEHFNAYIRALRYMQWKEDRRKCQAVQ